MLHKSEFQVNPLVSVCVASFNNAQYIVSTLDSIINQTYRPLEIIVVDDCSTDNSVEVIQNWLANYNINNTENGCDVTFVQKEQNSGVCSTFNAGVVRAKGKYIGIIGSDDILIDTKLQRQVDVFEQADSSIGIVYSDAYLINDIGSRYYSRFIQWNRFFEKAPEGYIFDMLLEGNFIPIMTALFKKECFDKFGLFDENLYYEDYDMLLRLSKEYAFKLINPPCAEYRIHSGNFHKKLLSLRALETDFAIFYKHVNSSGSSREIVNKRLLKIIDGMARLKSSRLRYYLDLYNTSLGRSKTIDVALTYHLPFRLLMVISDLIKSVKAYLI